MIGAASLTPTQEEIINRHKAFRAKIAAMAVPDSGVELRPAPAVFEVPPPKKKLPEKVIKLPEPPKENWFWPVMDDPPRQPSISEIQRACARYFDVTREEMLGPRRSRDIVRPRQIAVYLCRRLTIRSLPEIGKRFGGRDHTTALASIRVIQRLCRTDIAIAHDVAHLEAHFA